MTTHLSEPLLYYFVGGKCAIGYYCPKGAPKKILCTPGYVCNDDSVTTPSVKCAAGYYCERGAADSLSSKKKPCPVGYYCIEGSAEPVACPAGTYSNALKKEAIGDCLDCTKNFYCPNVAATSVDTTNHKCDPGFICPVKSTHARHTVCPLGFKCPQADDDKIACDPATGKYQDRKGAITCNSCPVGYLCDATSATRCEPHTTAKSEYCAANASSKTTCADGTYSY